MKLPSVVPSRLQRVVADEEFELDLSFDELCEAVSKNKWAITFGFSPKMIGTLILHHNIDTKCSKPSTVEKVAEPIGISTDFSKPNRDSASTVTKSVEVADDPQTAIAKLSEETEKASKTVPTSDTPGKGKKQCPSCKKYIGNRNALCACGHQFSVKNGQKFDHLIDDKTVGELLVESVEELAADLKQDNQQIRQNITHVNRDRARYRIHTPSGGSPHRLSGIDDVSVERWAEECRRTFLSRNGGWLGLSALKYLVRDFYSMVPAESGVDPTTTEYAKVCRVLDSLYSDPDLN